MEPYWGVIGNTPGDAEGADEVREAPKAPTKALPHTQQATVHPTSYRTFNKLLYIQQATVHSTSYRTFNKLPYTRLSYRTLV